MRARPLLERRKNLIALHGKQRHHPRENRTEEHQTHGKGHHNTVHVNGFNSANVLPRSDEPLNHTVGHHYATRAAQGRQDKASGEMLPNQTSSPSTHPPPNAQLPSPPPASR